MLLIAYDGSADSETAIDHIARLMPGARATVLTAWQPYLELVTAAGLGWTAYPSDNEEVDRAASERAAELAEEGAERARVAGLVAEGLARARSGAIHEAILDAADDLDADAVVLGSRGLTGVKSMLLGSVSSAVAHHANRPVVIVPSDTVAQERTAGRRRDAEGGAP